MSLREGDDLEAAAGLVVAALREAYGVLHPAFLVDSLDLVVDEDPTGLEMEPPVRPLDVRVDETLAEVLGHPPERDADGDIPLRVGDSVLFVRTTADATTIQVFAELVVEVDDLERAAFEVGVLNREVSGCQFVLAGPMIVMRREVMAAPYVGEHLLRAVDEASHAAERWAAVTAVRVGGRCFLDVD